MHTYAPGAVLRGQQALVADVKYRPVHRFTPSQMREVNDQLLRYMGLSHAGVGLILWPGDPVGSRLFEGRLPGGRARMARLRLSPLDEPDLLRRDLAGFFQGVS